MTSKLQNSSAEPANDDSPRPSHSRSRGTGRGEGPTGSSFLSGPGLGTPATAPSKKARQAWLRSLLIFSLASIVLLWTFRTEIGAATTLWSNSASFGHGYFIFPITLFLIFRMRSSLASLTPIAASSGLAPFLFMCVLWILGDLANIMVVRQLAFVGLWQTLFLIVMGWRITWSLFFPLAYLYLAVPLGSEVIPLLQDVTAQMVVHLLRLTGMPVFLDGYYIQIPSGSFLVAEACSGLRFLIVCIALGLLIAYLFFRSWPKRLLFVGLSIVVPIVANGIRAYGIIMLAHLSDYRIAADVDHIVYGFIFLSAIILVLIGLAALLRDRVGPGSPQGAEQPPQASNRGLSGAVGQVGLTTLAIVTVVLAQSWTAMAKAPPQGSMTADLYAPDLSPQWTVDEPAEIPWRARFAPADATLARSYTDGSTSVDLQIAYYAYQREGKEALSELNTLLVGDTGWQMVSQQRSERQAGDRSVPLIEMVVQGGGGARLVWYWYQVGGSPTNSRIVGKLLELKSMILAQDPAAAIVVISADMEDGRQDAASAIERFLDAGMTDDAHLVRVEK